jgi:hypothetical protein
VDCKDQETDYPRWIVEAWERLLVEHFRNIEDPENALVSRELSDCTLIAPASKHPEEWLTREYTEIHSGETRQRQRDPRGFGSFLFAVSPSCPLRLLSIALPHFVTEL